jgi:hypothetical protein
MSLEAASTSNLTYGEVDFHSLAVLLEKVDPAAGEVFVDLGSGTGKAVIAAVSGRYTQFVCGSECQFDSFRPSFTGTCSADVTALNWYQSCTECQWMRSKSTMRWLCSFGITHDRYEVLGVQLRFCEKRITCLEVMMR